MEARLGRIDGWLAGWMDRGREKRIGWMDGWKGWGDGVDGQDASMSLGPPRHKGR